MAVPNAQHIGGYAVAGAGGGEGLNSLSGEEGQGRVERGGVGVRVGVVIR